MISNTDRILQIHLSNQTNNGTSLVIYKHKYIVNCLPILSGRMTSVINWNARKEDENGEEMHEKLQAQGGSKYANPPRNKQKNIPVGEYMNS